MVTMMIGITLKGRRRASLMKEQSGLKDILTKIEGRKPSLAGHVMRKEWATRAIS